MTRPLPSGHSGEELAVNINDFEANLHAREPAASSAQDFDDALIYLERAHRRFTRTI